MIVKVATGAIIGIDSYPIDVEIDVASKGLPYFSTVGLPDTTVRESKDRVKSAIKNSGYSFPKHRITINLAPADLRKEGTAFDLPIAVGILAAQSIIKGDNLSRYIFIGELSLDGSVRPVNGALSAAFQAQQSGQGLVLPRQNALEAAIMNSIDIIPVDYLSEVVEFLNETCTIDPVAVDSGDLFSKSLAYPFDFSEVGGQAQAKRALEVAAAGGHNILMIGPPGSGKTMLAQRLVTILPKPSFEEAVETTKIHSVAGIRHKEQMLMETRPFRAPHHSVSDAGLVGGGQVPRPGEISLAHNGVLFLDELPEFRRNVLEVLRQPLEEGAVTITRASATARYPSRFMLVAAMNPCPCGYYTDSQHACRCTPHQIRQYRSKISGPLLDRIDIHIEVPSIRYSDLETTANNEPSETMRKRVEEARSIQKGRLGNGSACNAHMTNREIRTHCALNGRSKQLIEMAIDRLGLSARAYTKIAKVARTIADLEGEKAIEPHHVSEAIQYRNLDRIVI